MAGDSTSEQGQDDSDSEFVETDPTGRYGRYKEILGKGAFKTVYKAFDELEGIEVAWNQIKLADVMRNCEDLERLFSEVHLLKTLKHKSIIKFYCSWVDTNHDNINFITEIFTSGTLRQYRKKHKHVDLRALKNWSRQILEGLLYLHDHDPPVIHRDLKCDNIFVNGNQGEVKIGDLGLAAILQKAHSAHSVIGTPEFMAPELYEEEYNELVDIYAFGMCLLELVTFEYPYIECANAAQIYKKVTAGIKPASLEKVKDPGVREFIEKCIAKASVRLPARELLMDPFLQLGGENESAVCSLRSNLNLSDVTSEQFDVDTDSVATTNDLPGSSRDFMVEGQRKDINTIFLKLRVADSTGHDHNIHFPFDVEVDTAFNVASEMVAELDLTDQDVTTLAAMIDSEIQAHIPEWPSTKAFEDNYGGSVATTNNDSETKDQPSPLSSDLHTLSSGLVLEQLSSGRKYWSDSHHRHGRGSVFTPTLSNLLFQQEDSSTLTPRSKDNVQTGDFSISSEQQSESLDDEINEGKKECGVLVFMQSCDNQNRGLEDREGQHFSNGAIPLGENSKVFKDNEPEDVRIIAEKIELLLIEHQKELDELKTKHELAIADLLKELPPETRHRVFDACNLKVPDCRTHDRSQWCSEHSADSFIKEETLSCRTSNSHVDNNFECSPIPPSANNLTQTKRVSDVPGISNLVRIFRKVRIQVPVAENKVGGSVLADRSNISKGDSKSSSNMGIAVILGDYESKS